MVEKDKLERGKSGGGGDDTVAGGGSVGDGLVSDDVTEKLLLCFDVSHLQRDNMALRKELDLMRAQARDAYDQVSRAQRLREAEATQHENVRREVWTRLAVAALAYKTVGPIELADTILKAYDERFHPVSL